MKSGAMVARACGVLLFTVSCASVFAQSVQFVIVGKHIENLQTSATDVQVNPTPQGPLYGGPYGFSVNVEGVNVGQLAAPVVSGPFNGAALGSFLNGGKLVFNAQEGSWRLGFPNANDWGSPTRGDLDSKFGSGTYTVNVAGASVPLLLSGDAYPNTPLLKLTGGTWANGKYRVDAGKSVTVTTNAYTGYGAHVDDRIAIFVEGQTEQGQFHSAVAAPNTFSYTIPASTLASGQEYNIGADFNALVDVRSVPALPGSFNAAVYTVSTVVKLVVNTPVFPMVVSGSITPTVANITADIKYRPQDVGTTGSVYVFALAPATLVKNAVVPSLDKHLGPLATGSPKDAPLPCILAQLTPSGQLNAASASSLQPLFTNVLGSQGASISVLNGVSTANVQGAVFYVGYGPNSTAMLNNGINRSVVTVPGAQTCQPQAPQTGWWWNKNEPGRGFSVEAQGNGLFMAGYLYDASGRATWTVSGGLTSLDGSLYTGTLQSFASGQTLTGSYKPPAAPTSLGLVTMTFTDARNGTLAWPGGTIPIERFDVGQPTIAPPAFVPESGWWWSSAESGRGYFMEFRNNSAFIAGYMYDASGNPLWYAAGNSMASPQRFQGSWTQYANGQTLTGAYKPAEPVNGNVGPIAIQFGNSTQAVLTLPGGRQIPVTRFGF